MRVIPQDVTLTPGANTVDSPPLRASLTLDRAFGRGCRADKADQGDAKSIDLAADVPPKARRNPTIALAVSAAKELHLPGSAGPMLSPIEAMRPRALCWPWVAALIPPMSNSSPRGSLER